MNRMLAATKRLAFGEPQSKRAQKLHGFFRLVFPFLYQPEVDAFPPNYNKRDDHLFLPETRSAKHLIQHETVAFVLFLILTIGLGAALLAAFYSVTVLVVLTAFVSIFYFIFIVFKIAVVYQGQRFPLVDVSIGDIASVTDEELPTYTILVPLLYEAEVAEQVVRALKSIDYPQDKLNLIITLEEYDHETRDALKAAGMPDSWSLCILPDTQPKAKPKSLNVAFLETYGEFLVIYDAEILPDPDQLKKAFLAFRRNPDIAVMQTRLDHYNYDQNVLTRLFNTEFTFHYDMFLPGLQHFNFPVPLSGHSVHMRTEALVRSGAWDSYNVAEDCELGLRLFRHGYRTGIMNSMSREEAASTFSSWIKQRTRWMKGFIQTSIVHLRYPLVLKKQLGSWRNFLAFVLLIPGTVVLNLLNFFSWFILLAWFITGADAIKDMYPMAILYLATTAAIVGGFVFTYLNMIALYKRERFHLVKYFLLTPVYWFMLALATARAVWQLRDAKHAHVWEKTVHGTHLVNAK